MFTIDASVHINAYHKTEAGSEESRAFLERVIERSITVYSPTLLMVEVSTAVARVLNSTERGIALLQTVQLLSGQVWVPLDEQLAESAALAGVQFRLRGADAVYAAVAHRHKTTLVTLDQQQITRLSIILTVCRPVEALTLLD